MPFSLLFAISTLIGANGALAQSKFSAIDLAKVFTVTPGSVAQKERITEIREPRGAAVSLPCRIQSDAVTESTERNDYRICTVNYRDSNEGGVAKKLIFETHLMDCKHGFDQAHSVCMVEAYTTQEADRKVQEVQDNLNSLMKKLEELIEKKYVGIANDPEFIKLVKSKVTP